MAGRQRDLLPLPLLVEEAVHHGSRLSRATIRRIQKRTHVQREANLVIGSLNALYTGGKFSGSTSRVSDLECLPLSQRMAIKNIIRRVRDMGGPPEHVTTAGALEALRIAYSPYGGDSVGVGDVVPMKLEFLSIPEVEGDGVDISSRLAGAPGEYLRDPKKLMLQDADNWGAVSDEVRKIRTYDDPQLRQIAFYKRFLSKLKKAGLLAFSRGAAGRVGAFVVRKKPKEVNGELRERQRLILDCRRVNALFRAPPVTELGSLAAVGDLFIPPDADLYISGGDIRDCFYACRLPDELLQYFCFSFDITVAEAAQINGGDIPPGLEDLPADTMVSPGLNVLPMGFSWSFYLVQALHVQACIDSLGGSADRLVLDARPPPSLSSSTTLSMPYCDNTHILSLRADASQDGKDRVKETLQGWGFDVHEEVSATTLFPTLGGVIDGQAGLVRASSERIWRLRRVCHYMLSHPVSSKMVQQVLGHSMVVLVLNRSGMGIFRSAYDFAAKGFKRKELWPSAKTEFENFSGILPMLVSDLRLPWSRTVTVTDASPEGFGICEKEFAEESVGEVGCWQERWRYKRTPIEEWAPRRRALGDPLSDLATAARNPEAFEQSDVYSRNEEFAEVPSFMLEAEGFRVAMSGRWKHLHEHITLKEARTLTLAVRRLSRASQNHGKKHLVLVDNLGLALSIGKGRSANHAMLRVNQKIGALLLACNIVLRARWIPSELNVADGPSRGKSVAGYLDSTKGKEEEACRRDPGQEHRDSTIERNITRTSKNEEIQRDNRHQEDRQEECVFRAKECGGGILVGQGSRGKESTEWAADPPGEKEHQLRAREPTCALPRQVQGLLQGQRFSVAAAGESRPAPSRLLRHPLPGRAWCQRWRKDTCSCRVPVAKVKGNLVEKPESSQGLEKGGPAQEQTSASSHCGIRDRHADAEPAGEEHGVARPSLFRCLPETRGGFGSQSEEPRASSTGERKAVPALRGGREGRRGPGAGQDRSFQQLTSSGPPADFLVAGRSAGKAEKGQEGQRPAFQHEQREVPQGFRVSRRLVGVARAAHLPAATWRGRRRLGYEDQGVCLRQGSWPVEDGHLGQKIWQGGESSVAFGQDAQVGPRLLPEVGAPHGAGPQRLQESAQQLSPLWQDWRQAPPGSCLEIFAGSGRLTTEFRKAGISAYAIDTCLHPGDNVLDPGVERQILALLNSRIFSFVWLGMPCNTFSIARRHDGKGPRPLRSHSRPMGVSGLKAQDRRALHEGNQLLYFTCRVLCVCEMRCIPYVLESPWSSRCWQTPLLKQLMAGGRARFIKLHLCQFQERWRKPTALLHVGVDLRSIARCCKGSLAVCSATGKRHLPLHGFVSDGRFMTSAAQPYPYKLVNEVVQLVSAQLSATLHIRTHGPDRCADKGATEPRSGLGQFSSVGTAVPKVAEMV